jgi:hypothetical protein
MPILPGTASFEELGGSLTNYTEVVDPTTDLPDVASNQARAIVAGLSRLAPRVFLEFTNDGITGTLTPGTFNSVVGNGATNYPGVLRVSEGWYRFVFPATCIDFLGSTQSWNFKRAKCQILTGAPGLTRGVKVEPNVVDIFLYNLSGIEADFAGERIEVEVY